MPTSDYLAFVLDCAKSITSGEQVAQLATDITYSLLFDMDTEALRAHFKLPPDADHEAIRDCMGIDALRAIALVEESAATKLSPMPFRTVRDVIIVVWNTAVFVKLAIDNENPDFSLESGGK